MQAFTAPPRDGLTEAQVRALLTGDDVTVDAGLELLNASHQVTNDLSEFLDLDASEVARSNYADVHGSCTLRLTQQLDWGTARVRPYMVLSNDLGLEARFNLGVYLLMTPDEPRTDSDEVAYEVQGVDELSLLQNGPGDTYVVDTGTKYIDAVRAVLVASGVSAPLSIDGTLQDTALAKPMVWALTSEGSASWIRIINDLLAAIGYRGLYANADGVLRSGPYASPANRSVEWAFDTSDTKTNLVGSDRVMHVDLWSAPNWWRFIRRDMETQPVEGDGLYTVENIDLGLSSQTSLGRVVRKVVFLDAADQASLVSQGDQMVAEDRAVTRTFDIEVDPLPIAGHFDIVRFTDSGETNKCQVVSWTLPLSGAAGTWTLEAVDA